MKFSIESRIMGRTITFSRPGSMYIYANINGEPGSLGNQICQGGGIVGSTISYAGESDDEFEAISRKWYRSYIKELKQAA